MHHTFQSPFTQRYGGAAMRELWSEQNKRRLWRQLWVKLAEAQLQLGIVNVAQVDDLRVHANDVTEASIARALEIEREIHHDLMAEVHAFAEQCPIGGGIIHLGATSMDIEDNAEAMRLHAALTLTLTSLEGLLRSLAAQVERYADLTTMAFTHLQPAEPTTLGYRLAQYLQDLCIDLDELRRCRDQMKGKGFRGAVGTSASYLELCDADPLRFASFNQHLNQSINQPTFEVVTQTYPRKQDWLVLNVLAGISQSLYKFAFDLRVLQSPPIGELAEPFASKQVGSSAMPFKRNPINAEKIDSLARFVATLPRVMWDNAAHSLLERTLDDSANRRVVLPEAFLAVDEMLRVATRIVRDLRINTAQIARNMATYGPFAATERLLMAAVKAGGDRQNLHEVIRSHSMQAWAAINAGQANPLIDSLCVDVEITRLLPAAQARALLDASAYVGDAPARARALAARIQP